MMIKEESLHKLRAIAQGYGIDDIFQKTASQLKQEISLKQVDMAPNPEVPRVMPQYDARLMTRPPSKISTKETLNELLAPLIERGLRVTYPTPEEWHMSWDRREDTGTMRQPLKNVLECANRLVK